jgi:hypothetical protein
MIINRTNRREPPKEKGAPVRGACMELLFCNGLCSVCGADPQSKTAA